MERTERRVHPIFTTLVSLSVAGTCLAVPGIALADEAAAGDGAAVQEAVADGAVVLSAGGVSVTAAEGMETVDGGDAMQLAALPDGGLSLAVSLSDEGDAVPTDGDVQSYFDGVAEGLAIETGGSITSNGTVDLADGTTAYTYEIDEPAEEEGGLASRIVFVLVPTPDGSYATVQVSCVAEDTSAYDADIDAMIGSITVGEAVDGAQILSYGGVRIDIPLDMEIVELPENVADDMQAANLPGGTLSVAITASGADEAMPADADPEEFFAGVADGLAAELGTEITTSGTLDLADGTTAYTYEIDEPAEEEGGLASRIVFVLVPTGDGAYATVQISCFDTDVEAHADAIDAMLGSIALSEEDPAASAASVDLPQQVEAGGVALSLPEDVAEVDAEDGARWENADGSLIVRVVADALSGEEATSDAVLADVEQLASMVDGTVGEGAVMWNDDETTVQTFAVSFEYEGVDYVTTYGYVVLEDGTATLVIGDCTAEQYEDGYAAVLDAVYGSIELA